MSAVTDSAATFPYAGHGAVVAGGGSGIGRALALRLANAGMDVAIADINLSDAEQTAADGEDLGGRAWAYRCDVTDEESVAELAAASQRTLGRVALLCNNAGVANVKCVAAMNADEWRWIVDVNLLGVVHGVNAFLPGMISAGEPAHILNTASIAGLVPTSALNSASYVASKYGVVGLSEAMRIELEPYRIGVSILCPGGVNSNLLQTVSSRGIVESPLEATNPGDGRPAGRRKIDAEEAAAIAVAGIRDNQLYIVTHPQFRYDVELRFRAILNAFDTLDVRAMAP